jgi:glutamate racemase
LIGVFDSGVGGMSVVQSIQEILPTLDLLYFADSGRAPYGRRPLLEVRGFAEEITGHLLASGAELIVVACNAASAAALHHLRGLHPEVSFVGMEPAVKPAASQTRSKVVGVLTTAATFQGELFASVVDRFASNVRIETQICDGWVELVEAGLADGVEADRLVATHVAPLLDAGADTLVLGCTHYPFLGDRIRAIAGDGIQMIDPAPAIARQVDRLLPNAPTEAGLLRVETTGDPKRVAHTIATLTGLAPPVSAVTFTVP